MNAFYMDLIGLYHWVCLIVKVMTRSKSFRCTESARQRQERVDNQLRGLQTGDLICIEQTLFVHFTVYMGDGIIAGNQKSGILYQNLYEKVGKNDCYICNYLDGMYSHFQPEVITDQVKRIAKEKEFRYSIFFFNCEHFATLCRYGVAFCRQPCWMNIFVTCYYFIWDVKKTISKMANIAKQGFN
ncbi:phospholipase A and acyltransferase 3-like [Pecten maximus]|uniref:phospholipase A and acyltransferase 3-like n=1 Tax=Pecten maximus TaxID=6579 RepID=UPI001457EFD9|nr:phospholipase A and acyltransferase 3-like [Pecten maximus]